MDITSGFANDCIDKANKIIFNFEYHEGYYAAGKAVPYDENQSDAWKEGYKDGCAAINGDDELYGDQLW